MLRGNFGLVVFIKELKWMHRYLECDDIQNLIIQSVIYLCDKHFFEQLNKMTTFDKMNKDVEPPKELLKED